MHGIKTITWKDQSYYFKHLGEAVYDLEGVSNFLRFLKTRELKIEAAQHLLVELRSSSYGTGVW